MPADPATDASSWIMSDALGEPDYEAIHAAIVATEEGRWFLAQYACRNLDAETARRPAAIDHAEAPMSSPAASPPGPDIARLSRDLGEFADALMRARADVAAIAPPGAAAERPSILAASEALQELAWFMRERGIDPLYCDRIDGCAGDIAAACAIPDLTAQRTRAIVDVLGDLESRLHVIRAALDGGIRGDDQFGDLGSLPAANANSPVAPNPVASEAETTEAGTLQAETIHAEMIEAETIQAESIPAKSIEAEPIEAETTGAETVQVEPTRAETTQAEAAVFTLDPLAEMAAAGVDAEITAPAGTEAVPVAAPASQAEELDLCFDDRPAAASPAGTQASPRLSHLLMAAELDRLLEAQAADGNGAGSPSAPEPAAVTAEETPSVAAPVEAVASDQAIAPDEAIAPAEVAPPEAVLPVEASAPVAETTPVEVAAPAEASAAVEAAPPQAVSSEAQSSSSEAAVAPAPVAPAAPPPRRISEIPKDAFADVMALSEAERIALFS